MELIKDINPQIFREYDLRGIVPDDIDANVAYTLGKSFGSYIQKDGNKEKRGHHQFGRLLNARLHATRNDIMNDSYEHEKPHRREPRMSDKVIKDVPIFFCRHLVKRVCDRKERVVHGPWALYHIVAQNKPARKYAHTPHPLPR